LDGTSALRLPRYVRIADALRYRLTNGWLGPNGRLPSEAELALRFSVSRETVREALTLLRDEGLIYSVSGKGSFVSPGHKPIGVRITQPIREPYVAGRPSKVEVLAQGYTQGGAEACRSLGLSPRARVYVFEILRTIGVQPFRACRVYLPPDAAEQLDLQRRVHLTVSEKLETEAGIRLIRAQQEVVAVVAPAAVAGRLRLTPHTPVLRFRRTYYRDSGRPMEYVEEYQNSVRFPYEETAGTRAALGAGEAGCPRGVRWLEGDRPKAAAAEGRGRCAA